MGFERKLVALSALRPDIAVLSEVACPEKLRSQCPALEGLPIVWVGNKPNKGLGVVSFTGSSLELDPSYRSSISSWRPSTLAGRNHFACSLRGITTTVRKASTDGLDRYFGAWRTVPIFAVVENWSWQGISTTTRVGTSQTARTI
jgi:hypothetical protein